MSSAYPVAATTPVLKVDGLNVNYGKVEAVRNASFSLHAGRVDTIIGPNGAGKSSLLNALLGLVDSHGSIQLDGQDLSSAPTEQRAIAGLGLVPERRELFGSMTVIENLMLGGFSRATRAERNLRLQSVFDRFPRLKERRTQLAATLSGGERQMLALGRALMGNPRVLLLDEPSLGLAPRIVAETLDIVSGLRTTGVAILLVEQNARAALEMADHAHVMNLGELIRQGEARKFLDDPSIVESYLGTHRQPSIQAA